MKRRKTRKGFTLIELIVVVIIMGILSSVIIITVNKIRRQAQANKVVHDFKQIERAFESWMTDTGVSRYPRQTAYGTNGALPCQDEPALSATDLFSNVQGYAGWSGPYLQAPLRTPWQVEYTYDNDGDRWPEGGRSAGVNLMLQWCSRREGAVALGIAPILDKNFDREDGNDLGFVRWSTSTSSGSLRILLAPRGN